MRALEYSDVAVAKWVPLAWIVVGLFLAYAVARNCPGESLEASPLEVRNLGSGFVHEVRNYPHPIGWPMLSIRPVNGYFWNSDFQVSKMGPHKPVAKTAFFLSVCILNIAIMLLNAIAIVFLIQTKTFKFSIRSMLVVIALGVFLLIACRPLAFQSLWNGIDTLVIAACFAPLAIGGPIAYYLHFTYNPYNAPEPRKRLHLPQQTPRQEQAASWNKAKP